MIYELMTTSIDFLSVRKIPIREHPYILTDGTATRNVHDSSIEDDIVNTFVSRIRQTVTTDRGLHDKVATSSKVHTCRHFHVFNRL